MPSVLFASGLSALESGDLAAAEQAFQHIVSERPLDHAAWHALAWTYLRSGRGEFALDAAQRAHESNRQNVDYLNTLGVAYGETGRLDLAEATFRKVLRRSPVFVDGLINLAKALEKKGALAEATRLYERALALDPDYPRLAANLASACREQGAAARSREVLERHARRIDPEHLAVALAACDLALEGPSTAIRRLSAAVAEHPEWVLAQDALAQALLAAGEWREGWKHYGSRHLPRGRSAALRLEGQSVLLRGEQGIGDVLFFLRFLPLLNSRGVSASLACERKLHPILEGLAVREPAADDDGLWIGDLPALLECEDTPAAWPLQASDAERSAARGRLAALGPPPYLAVTWRAGTDTARASEFGGERMALSKHVPPAALAATVRGWPGTVVALQRGARADDAMQFGKALGAPFHDLSFLTDDLPALLGVLAEIDEYVAVSNTNVHLLAGLGRTAKVLLPWPAEWRWMRRDGASPWFPGFAVYRQPPSRDWTEPLARLRQDLSCRD